MMNKISIIFYLLTLLLSNCSKSPLGPQISDRKYEDANDNTTVVSGSDPDDNSGGSTTGGGSVETTTVGDGTAEVCNRTSGHNVYYFASAISLVYTCERAIEEALTTSMPSYLTKVINDKTITFSGTAPSTESTTSWSFAVNANTTSGNASSITTQIIDTATLSASITASPDLANNNNTALDLTFKSTLSSSWDGAMTDVTLALTSASSDLHGLTFYAACASAAISYICNGTASTSSLTIDGAGTIRWQYSAFDQGNYFITPASTITVESSAVNLSMSTSTFTIPIQSAGNIALSITSDTENANTYDDSLYSYDIHTGGAGTDIAPAVGILYVVDDGDHATYFNRLTIDRTDDPSGGANGITQSTELLVSNGANSQDFHLTSYQDASDDTHWVALGGIVNGSSKRDIRFNRITDSASAPTIGQAVTLTSFTVNSAKAIALSEPFADDYTSDPKDRIGMAYVKETANQLVITKLDPTGSDLASIVDDTNYPISPTSNKVDITATKVDRVGIQYVKEGSQGKFYLVYRNTTNIDVTKINSDNNSSYSINTQTLAAGALADSDTSNEQDLKMALGSYSGSTVVAAIWRESAGTRACYFKRFNSDLTTASTTVTLTTNRCQFPNLHFNTVTGRFVATFSERDAGSLYDISSVEITLAADGNDTAAATTIVTADLNARPIKLVSDYYAAGDWMPLIYRRESVDEIRFHAYHVSDR